MIKQAFTAQLVLIVLSSYYWGYQMKRDVIITCGKHKKGKNFIEYFGRKVTDYSEGD